MSIVKEFREFFLRNTTVTSGSKLDKETNFPLKYNIGTKSVFNRFLKNHFPSESVWKKLFESITFKLNIEDTATTTAQGLTRIGTDLVVRDRTPKGANDFATVVAPEQLSDVLNSALFGGEGVYTLLDTTTANGIIIQQVSKNLGGGRFKKDFVIKEDVTNSPSDSASSVLISEYLLDGVVTLTKKYVTIDSIATKIPTGMIMIWTSADTIPAGWQLADGSNGTPDLSGMSIGDTVFVSKL